MLVYIYPEKIPKAKTKLVPSDGINLNCTTLPYHKSGKPGLNAFKQQVNPFEMREACKNLFEMQEASIFGLFGSSKDLYHKAP